jgi:hypothetical protein
MKKLILALGIFVCSLLFFLAGSLIGYTAHDAGLESAGTTERTQRKPSQTTTPMIWGIVRAKPPLPLGTTMRTPTPSAITRAQSYTNISNKS